MSIDELFDYITANASSLNLDPSIKATVFFDLTGPEARQWRVDLAGGRATAESGHPKNPDVTVTAASETALALFEKRMKPMMAFLTGKVKIKGDPKLILHVKKLLQGDGR